MRLGAIVYSREGNLDDPAESDTSYADTPFLTSIIERSLLLPPLLLYQYYYYYLFDLIGSDNRVELFIWKKILIPINLTIRE